MSNETQFIDAGIAEELMRYKIAKEYLGHVWANKRCIDDDVLRVILGMKKTAKEDKE